MIAFKNIFLKKCIIFFFLIIFLNFFPNKEVVAHELWLEKNSNLEDKILIDIMIGQNFKGTPFGFSNNEKEKFLDILSSYNPSKLPTENYKRFSKILISNSNDFFQQTSKLDFELIALNSPFDKKN